MSAFLSPRKKSISVIVVSCFLLGASAISGLAQEIFLVTVDQAKILRLDRPAATVIIGNPMIADATVQDEQLLVITGKTFGTTNLIVLDREGEEILSTNLEVRFTSSSQLTIYRGNSQFSYACSPTCEPTLRIGDNVERFEALKEEITGRNEIATGLSATQ